MPIATPDQAWQGALDEVQAISAGFALAVASFYKALIEKGIPEAAAAVIVAQYVSTLMLLAEN